MQPPFFVRRTQSSTQLLRLVAYNIMILDRAPKENNNNNNNRRTHGQRDG